MILPITIKEKDEYCEAWAHNAAYFEQQGCYAWMADQLRPLNPTRILDIGCGTGEGIFSLLTAFTPKIVSLEENARCIQSTANRLNELGWSAEPVYRLGYIEYPDGTHDLVTDDESIPDHAGVTLIHTEFLSADPPVDRFLGSAGRFDAVTVWLPGAFKLRASCRALKNYKIKTADEYRVRVEHKAHDVAHRVLRPGGWLQIVFRGEVPQTEHLRKTVLDSYQEQASTTDLEVFAVTYREYQEHGRQGVRMVWSRGGEEVPADSIIPSMCSVLSRKPN